jgi:molybdopterin converting factor small subunit
VATVVLSTDLSRRFTGGRTRFEVKADNIRHLIRELDQCYPGMGRQLEVGMAVAIDGVIFQDAFLEPVGADSEVHFLPAIAGG